MANPNAPEDERTFLDALMDSGRSPGWLVMLFVSAFGIYLASQWAPWVAIQPWDLSSSSSSTLGEPGRCDGITGGRYQIEIDGQVRQCGGAPSKCPGTERVAVAYDAAQPDRCRVAAVVDSLSRYERITLAGTIAFLAVGVAATVWLVAERYRRLDILADRPRHTVARNRLRATSWIALAVSVLASNVAGWLHLSG